MQQKRIPSTHVSYLCVTLTRHLAETTSDKKVYLDLSFQRVSILHGKEGIEYLWENVLEVIHSRPGSRLQDRNQGQDMDTPFPDLTLWSQVGPSSAMSSSGTTSHQLENMCSGHEPMGAISG